MFPLKFQILCHSKFFSMTPLFFSLGAFIVWSLSIITIYYSKSYSSIDHIESTTGHMGYLITILGLYLIYKAYTLFIAEKKILRFNFWSIL